MSRAFLVAVATFALAPAVGVAEEAAPSSWQGAYVGGSIVHGQTEAMAVGGLADWIDITFPGKSHLLGTPDGTTGALRAGYDFALGPVVLGIGAEYVLGAYEGPFVDQPDSSVELREQWTVFARGGFDAGQWMPYVLAGYTRAYGEYEGVFTNPLVIHHLEDGVEGYTLGLGAEVRVHENWSLLAEYTHTDFGNLDAFEGNATLVLDQVKLGVNLRF